MISSLFSDSTFIIISLIALVFTIVAISQKLNDAIKSIRGKNVGDALSYLEFSKKRISNEAKKILESAIANAENNHNLDIDKLYVDEAYVGKNLVMKRFRPRARGRTGKILKPFSQLTIILREKAEGEKK